MELCPDVCEPHLACSKSLIYMYMLFVLGCYTCHPIQMKSGNRMPLMSSRLLQIILLENIWPKNSFIRPGISSETRKLSQIIYVCKELYQGPSFKYFLHCILLYLTPANCRVCCIQEYCSSDLCPFIHTFNPFFYETSYWNSVKLSGIL